VCRLGNARNCAPCLIDLLTTAQAVCDDQRIPPPSRALLNVRPARAALSDSWYLAVPKAERLGHSAIAAGGHSTESEAQMRKHISFAMAATIVVLAMISWAESSVVATNEDTVRPKVGLSPYVVMSNSYLPIQVLEEAY
jgi:hypothetical protein